MRRAISARRALSCLLVFVAALAAIAAVCAWRRGEAATRKYTYEFFGVFDTGVTFTAYADDEVEFMRCAGVVSGELRRLHELFDIYNDYDGLANLKTVNDSAGAGPVRVDGDIIELLELSLAAHGFTDGAVNVALGPVLSVWHGYRARAAAGDPAVPSIEELSAAAANTSVGDVIIDREASTVLLRRAGMRLDVGASAKGYAARRAAEAARAAGLRSGLINAGGNVVVIGPPADGRAAWKVGVRAPTAEAGDMSSLMDVLRLSSGAAVTSGSDQRFYEAGGRRYHHIIDPRTLFPATGAASVTVLHPDSATADFLSTAAVIMPEASAREMITRMGGEAVWVANDGTITATAGYAAISQTLGAKAAVADGEP
jgi:thiamine biosynthesis lipoprotein